MIEAIALICDLHKSLFLSEPVLQNPATASKRSAFDTLEATAEWEDEKTITSITETWRSLGYDVHVVPLDASFLTSFSELAKLHPETLLVHSLVEGWGTPSRESWLPALCELWGVPWIGSSVSSFSICMDKALVATLAQELGVPTPKGGLIRSFADYEEYLKRTNSSAHFIKPNFEGSGMGIGGESLRPAGRPLTREAIQELIQKYPDGIRVEELITGPEFTSALVGPETFLPIAEIKVPGGVYGLEHKQKDEMTEEVLFPELSESARATIEDGSRRLWRRLNLQDFSRFDWKLDVQGVPHLLEINPLAGLSPHYSVLPLLWKEAGGRYAELLQTLAHSAERKRGSRALNYGGKVSRATKGNKGA